MAKVPSRVALRVVPLELKESNSFVAEHHRHHVPVLSHRFSIGCVDQDGLLRGVAIVGRPVARGVDQRAVVEVTRLCTDGCPNACSFLYAAAARAAKEIGYTRIQTYIMEQERGTTLIAAGWSLEAKTKGGDWNTPARQGRRTDQPQERKTRWSRELNPSPPEWTRPEPSSDRVGGPTLFSAS